MAASEKTGVSIVEPVLDVKPWGGRKLAGFGFELPEDARIGEALVTANETQITSGMAAGRTLADVVRDLPGSNPGAISSHGVFPLLVKLIDAHENLSIQVHPDDAQAAPHGRLGKTEAWHVLAANPGSYLYAGLQDDVSSEKFLVEAGKLDGSSARLLRRIPAQPGTTILLPAGTVHALGAGVLVYEIQQPSDLTYRLDDWGRTDAGGNPREMHLDAGAAVMRTDLRPSLIVPVEIPAREGRRHLLAACQKFGLERIALPAGGRYAIPPSDAPQVVTVLHGAVRLADQKLAMGRSGVVWPDSSHVTLEASIPSIVLRGWVPDLKNELASIAALPGVEHSDMFRLSGPLPDIQYALNQEERTHG